LIHFDFEDRYQDELVVGQAISRREGVLFSVTLHVVALLAILFGGRLALFQPSPEELERERQEQARLEEERRDQRFVFVAPRVDVESLKLRERVDLSDQNRRAATPERAERPTNELPFARGNSAERTEAVPDERVRGPEAPTPEPPQPEPQPTEPLPREDRGLQRPPTEVPRAAGGALGDALRNLQRYVEKETFHNPQGGQTDPGATIQFDTKGVEFGPWLRRFVAQVKRNWFVPNAAMTFSGRVVLQFNIHKSGRITDVVVAQASTIDAFNRSAVNAILGSNPTEPLPPDYPEDRAFFTVTFYYNEPPGN
jgi:TonB family protein